MTAKPPRDRLGRTVLIGGHRPRPAQPPAQLPGQARPVVRLSLTPDPAARATAEAIDHADLLARHEAGLRLCEARNRRRWPAGWWVWPLAALGLLGVLAWGWLCLLAWAWLLRWVL